MKVKVYAHAPDVINLHIIKITTLYTQNQYNMKSNSLKQTLNMSKHAFVGCLKQLDHTFPC